MLGTYPHNCGRSVEIFSLLVYGLHHEGLYTSINEVFPKVCCLLLTYVIRLSSCRTLALISLITLLVWLVLLCTQVMLEGVHIWEETFQLMILDTLFLRLLRNSTHLSSLSK